MKLIFDIETDNLLADVTKLHCLVMIDVDTEQKYVCANAPLNNVTNTLEQGIDMLQKAELIIGHNILGFDIPALEKLYNISITTPTYDTLIASKLAYNGRLFELDFKYKQLPPKLKGSFSLKAWGYRLKEYKDEFGADDQWHTLTQSMLDYCIQDTVVTLKLYRYLLDSDITDEAMDLEQKFKRIIVRQEQYGWKFDIAKAQELHIELLAEADKAETTLRQTFKPLQDWIPMKQVAQFNKNGSVSKVWESQIARGATYNDDLEWGRYEELEFNPSSRHHIIRWLKEVYGWKPTEFTEKGTPIINDSTLNELTFPEGRILAHYFNVKKLLGQLAEGDNAWLKSLRGDRIHGSVDTLGAVTRRCTHSKPNLAQVPSARAFKGKECRALFTVGAGKKLVGCDADGLELRTLSHYMSLFDKGAYAKTVDEGDKDKGTDIHTINQKAAGLGTRDEAKTFIYAFLYGAGDEKIGTIINGGAKEGKALKEQFFSKIPAIKALIEKVQAQVKQNKVLKGLDGNPYFIRSQHSALNTLLQGAGALVMKYYLIELDKNLEKVYTNSRNYREGSWTESTTPQYEFVGNIHDEVQIECDEGISQQIADIAKATFDDVTKLLNFRIPLRGSAAIGNNWYDTH